MESCKCKTCGNRYHWHHAFAKFGYDDGDGNVQTPLVASILEDAGYAVKYSRWSPHNTIIYSISKNGIEYMPTDNPVFTIGYDNPALYLPRNIITILDEAFTAERIFY